MLKNDKGLAASFDSGLLVNEPAEPSMQLLVKSNTVTYIMITDHCVLFCKIQF